MKTLVRKITFLTGTRADFGKLKPLMLRLQTDSQFKVEIFVTGMHMLYKYGETHKEVDKTKLKNIHKFVNQNYLDGMDSILSKTISGFSDYVRERKPDMIVVHGDRVEALAAAIVGVLNNIKVAHIEGGEISGTVDELIRHAVTKMSNIHFVSNKQAYKRLVQLGEQKHMVHNIGSPDIDVMESDLLPNMKEVRRRYKIPFNNYGVLLFHPVTSEIDELPGQVKLLVEALLKSKKNYIVIYPNNDDGSDYIFKEYLRLKKNLKFRIIPSMRFEYFLKTLKNAEFIIGNSSAGIREAPHYGVPTINVGSRQYNRAKCHSIIDINFNLKKLLSTIEGLKKFKRRPVKMFGSGGATNKFHNILKKKNIWEKSIQKHFKDRKTIQSNY